MKTILRLSLLALGLALLPAVNAATDTTTEQAPRAGRAPHRAKLMKRAFLRHQLAKKLNLTAEQRQQLKAARTETASAIKAIRADASLSREQKRAKMRETIASAKGRVEQTLTPEQRAQVEAMRARHAKRRGGQ